MLTRSEFERNHPNLHEGMMAYSRDGEKLGTIVELEEESLTVQKGTFFPKDFTLRYDDIIGEQGDEIIVARDQPELDEWKDEHYGGWNEYERRNEDDLEARDRAKLELHEEQLGIDKHRQKAGEVSARKVVHTEIRTIEVPVRKEEVIVTRAKAAGDEPVTDPHAFKEDEITVPVFEEEVDVTKRPVKTGEVEIQKEVRTERKGVSEELRTEDVEIEDRGEVERKGKGTRPS